MVRLFLISLCVASIGCKYSPRARKPGAKRVTWVARADGTAFKMVGPTTISFEGSGMVRHGIVYVAASDDFTALNKEADQVMEWYRPFAEQDGDTWVGMQAVVHGSVDPNEASDSYRLPYEKDAKGEWHVSGTRPTSRPQPADKMDAPPSPDFERDLKAEQDAAAAALQSQPADAGPHRTVHSIRSFGSPEDRPGGPFIDVDLIADGDAKPRIETVHLSKRSGTWQRL